MPQRPDADVLDPTDGDRPAGPGGPAWDPDPWDGPGLPQDFDPWADDTVSPGETDPETGRDSETGRETPAGRAKPTKAETETAAAAAVDNTRRGRRRRRAAGYAMVGLIVMSAAASVVGWPIVLAAAAVTAGTGGTVAAAAKARRDPVRQAARLARVAQRRQRHTTRRRQGPTGGGAGRGRRGGGLFGGRAGGRAGGRTTTGARSGGLLGGGRKKSSSAATPGTRRSGRPTTGARSGGTANRRTGRGGTGTGLFGRLGRRGPTTPTGGRHGRTGVAPRTARQAKRESVRQAKVQRRQAAVGRRAGIQEARRARRWARSDRRRDARWGRRTSRRDARADWKARRRKARWDRRDARRDRRWARRDARRQRRWATADARRARRRRFVKRYLRRPARRLWRGMHWTRWTRWVGERAPVIAYLHSAAPPQQPRPGMWRRLAARLSTATLLASLGVALRARLTRQPAPPAAAAAPATAPAPAAPTYLTDPFRPTATGRADERAALADDTDAAVEAVTHRPRRPQPHPPVRRRPATTTAAPAAPGPRARQIITPPRGRGTNMTGTDSSGGGITHPAWEAASAALHDSIDTWEIPDDGDGFGDTDRFIASIGPFLTELAEVLDRKADYFGGETPVAPTVAQALSEFAAGLRGMGGDAEEVYEEWATNEDNEHDRRRAEGDVVNAQLFNV